MPVCFLLMQIVALLPHLSVPPLHQKFPDIYNKLPQINQAILQHHYSMLVYLCNLVLPFLKHFNIPTAPAGKAPIFLLDSFWKLDLNEHRFELKHILPYVVCFFLGLYALTTYVFVCVSSSSRHRCAPSFAFMNGMCRLFYRAEASNVMCFQENVDDLPRLKQSHKAEEEKGASGSSEHTETRALLSDTEKRRCILIMALLETMIIKLIDKTVMLLSRLRCTNCNYLAFFFLHINPSKQPSDSSGSWLSCPWRVFLKTCNCNINSCHRLIYQFI